MINLKNKKRFVIPMTLLLSLTMTSCGKKDKKIDDYDNSNKVLTIETIYFLEKSKLIALFSTK